MSVYPCHFLRPPPIATEAIKVANKWIQLFIRKTSEWNKFSLSFLFAIFQKIVKQVTSRLSSYSYGNHLFHILFHFLYALLENNFLADGFVVAATHFSDDDTNYL